MPTDNFQVYDRQCGNKTPYPTWLEAHRAARAIYNRLGDILIAYRCPYCHSYHLGHPKHTVEFREVETKG